MNSITVAARVVLQQPPQIERSIVIDNRLLPIICNTGGSLSVSQSRPAPDSQSKQVRAPHARLRQFYSAVGLLAPAGRGSLGDSSNRATHQLTGPEAPIPYRFSRAAPCGRES